MSVICEAAERKAQELGRRMSPYTREKLSTMDEESQVRWVTNPLMEWGVQYAINKILSGPTTCSTVTASNSTVSTSKTPAVKQTETKPEAKKVETKKPEPKPASPKTESDEDMFGNDLFG